MVQRTGGPRRKTRHMLSKKPRNKGKISLTRYLQKFSEGDRVLLKAEPAVQRGLYFRRFHGKSGIVLGQRGRCYQVQIKDQNKAKTVIVHPVHLKKVTA